MLTPEKISEMWHIRMCSEDNDGSWHYTLQALKWIVSYAEKEACQQALKTECMKCEEIISDEEFERNQGLCDKCYIRLCFVKELNSHRENTLL